MDGTMDSHYVNNDMIMITEGLRMFLWKLCRDIIPFGSRLQRIFGNEVRCVLCGVEEDSAYHLFFKCPIAKAVWIARRWSLRSETLCFDSPRNMAFREHTNPTWQGVLAKVNHATATLRTVWELPRAPGVVQLSLSNIYSGKLVLLVDAVYKDLRAAAGIVASISEGSVLEAMAVIFDSEQPLEAEMRAMINAVNWWICRDWKQVVIVSDCQLLVHGLHARRALDWRLAGLFWSLDMSKPSFCYPGDTISQWFAHQSMGSSLELNLPFSSSEDYYGNFLGFAL
ncbi:hypothetical protein G4B88_008541 [Cannabis sativa]|uniref:Reverse transcriptase zinc-binding domain-containing protein n=1 Tax=Cannabis sativa TaxID=3483 RepID=A0A7J6EJ30_CANSA|nr:hypothetical protein G4B88_008541 [Cannabis sativa]